MTNVSTPSDSPMDEPGFVIALTLVCACIAGFGGYAFQAGWVAKGSFAAGLLAMVVAPAAAATILVPLAGIMSYFGRRSRLRKKS